MKANYLSLSLNVETKHFSVSRGGIFILDKKPKGYEVNGKIATKLKVNPQMISTLKKGNPL